MALTACIAVFFGCIVRAPGPVASAILLTLLFVVPALTIYLLSWLPLRVRLFIELTVILALPLAIYLDRAVVESICLVMALTPAFAIDSLSRASPRVRLTVEIVVLLALLAFAAWIRQPRLYDSQSARAASLARLMSRWAEVTDDPQARAIFRREAAWFARKAFLHRCTGLWQGLIAGPFPPVRWAYSDEELIHELGVIGGN